MKDNIYTKMIEKGATEMAECQTVEEGKKGLNKVTNALFTSGYEKGLIIGGVSLIAAGNFVHLIEWLKNRKKI